MARTGRHLVVDGSNIATEGRTSPSLAQLDEAVQAIQAEGPDRTITVIVDATFAHRIDPSERSTFEDASDNGEILMPPAGAVGRGDAFILQVAEKADAAVLSNDSFQEFHGTHPWLFEEGRLIGGKPVEGVGWIFVERIPVRGPASRRATREAKGSRATKKKQSRSTTKRGGRTRSSKEAEGPPPVPSTDNPPPAARSRRRSTKTSGEGEPTKSTTSKRSTRAKAEERASEGEASKSSSGASKSSKSSKSSGASKTSKSSSKSSANRSKTSSNGAGQGSKSEALNSPEDFLRFVTQYSIGEEAEAVVERFSSHGCYVRAAGAQCYLPLAAMGDPAPNRARDVVSLGQTAIVRVNSLDSDRRGINVELVRVVTDDSPQRNPTEGRSRRRGQKQTSHQRATVADDSAREANPTRSDTTVATKKATKKAAAKKATKKAAKRATRKTTAKKAPAKATTSPRAAKAAARKSTKKTTRKSTSKRAAKKAPAKKAPAKKAAAKKTTKKAPAKKTATRKTATKRATKKAPTRKAPAKKAAAKKATRKAPAKRTAAKKATRKAPAKRVPAKKATRKATRKRG